mmetsp:Transcript_171592/g.417296  ORF Transcript_171592/g.417296 Transcript_171592/m.417296 type:complete len:318 (+) Transcript_171592:243-1196(+)
MAARGRGTARKGMIHLPDHNVILLKELTRRIGGEEPVLEPVDLRIADSDEVRFRLLCNPDAAPGIVFVTATLSCWPQLVAHGAEEVLAEAYGDLLSPDAPDGEAANVVIRMDTAALPAPGAEVAMLVASLKRRALGAPMHRAFRALETGEGAAPMAHIPYRRSEAYWVTSKPGAVSVAFSLQMGDPAEAAMARVFAQEFVEAQRHVNNAPAVLFSPEPAGELASAGIDVPDSELFVGFLTFTCQKSHIEGARLEKVVGQLSNFRSYTDYHIKAAKTYLHMRMRDRVNKLLQVLNRAVPPPFEVKEKKLASGKRFTRK